MWGGSLSLDKLDIETAFAPLIVQRRLENLDKPLYVLRGKKVRCVKCCSGQFRPVPVEVRPPRLPVVRADAVPSNGTDRQLTLSEFLTCQNCQRVSARCSA